MNATTWNRSAISPTTTFRGFEWVLSADETPPLAAHLIAKRVGYAHHGIYIGNGVVVHYSGLSRGWSAGPVQEVSLAKFSQGRPVRVRPHETPRFDAQQVIRRARSRLGERCYQLMSNNCEHFCEWCVQGESRSHQVELLKSRPRRLFAIGFNLGIHLRRCLSLELGGNAWAI